MNIIAWKSDNLGKQKNNILLITEEYKYDMVLAISTINTCLFLSYFNLANLGFVVKNKTLNT